MDYLLLFLFAVCFGYAAGEEYGRVTAQKAMHRGEVQCQTMPDKRIVCWEVEDVK